MLRRRIFNNNNKKSLSTFFQILQIHRDNGVFYKQIKNGEGSVEENKEKEKIKKENKK